MERRFLHRRPLFIFAGSVAVIAAVLASVPSIAAQAELGIGLVDIDFDDKTVIHFYDTPHARSPARTLRFLDDKSINGWNIVDLPSIRKWLEPESLWLEYSSLVFRCRSRRAGWMQVIVNNGTGKSYWVRAAPNLQFKTWEAFLKGMFSVARAKRFPQKILARPVVGSRAVRSVGRDCFDVMKMSGDWIQVRQAGHCEGTDRSFRSGWLRWRRGNSLLIEYFITS